MIKRITDAPAAVVDLWIYIGIGFLTAVGVCLGTDDAGRYIPLELLFWLKMGVNSSNAGLLAAKMYRSQAYGEHLRRKEAETAFTKRPAP